MAQSDLSNEVDSMQLVQLHDLFKKIIYKPDIYTISFSS